ncbi:helix-turn-helix domain-containing protein [Streptomyces sp. MBT33]|uniref:helix-turn-helix domain-containing protein n=1 Tax=Streptomyces sp. MBT33 TaxID=1488363 RepID=UPI00190E1A44|nr:helix-turn-helix domain-containing protein [Streptomyces sp. MBT33]MBK3647254.1 helix-turn-helix domain-containing protein [Streptomyces sp. MBT33]
MDFAAAWSKIGTSTKTAREFSAERINRATETVGRELDVIAPAFAPFAARWDAEADRRMALRTPENLKALIAAQRANTSARSTAATARSQRTAARKASKNPFNGARRAARTADKAATGHAKVARTDLKTARKNYPLTLRQLALRAHAAHTCPAAIASYLMSTPDDWAVWPAGTSLGLIALNAGALWLGRRQVSVQVDDEASAEERRLMERLAPTFWVQHADERGLSGTLTENPELTPAGIICGVRLDGKWSAKELASKADSVRALLGMKSETRMQISRGSHGDRALIVIRTRSASDGVSMIWTPDHVGIGVDEVTGEFVDVPMAGTHKLIAGVTNMGKSVSWRPWMMQAVRDPLWAGILLDPKRLEARLWHGKIRTEGHQRGSNEEIRQAIYDAIRELVAEMQHRQEIADVTQWVPTEEYPNLLVVIEEGRQILQMAKDNRWKDVLDLIDDLYTLARATGIWIIWATQYPSRTNGGVTAMVSENSLTVMSLTVDSPVSDRVVYGENAALSGWEPSKLNSVPGRALIKHKDRKPDPVRIWYVTDGTVTALPEVDPWRTRATTKLTKVPAPAPAPEVEETETIRPALHLVKNGGDFLLAPPAAEAPAPVAIPDDLTDNQAAVFQTVQDGASTNAEIAKATGMNPGSVDRAVKALVKRGLVVKDGTTIRLEVSA